MAFHSFVNIRFIVWVRESAWENRIEIRPRNDEYFMKKGMPFKRLWFQITQFMNVLHAAHNEEE